MREILYIDMDGVVCNLTKKILEYNPTIEMENFDEFNMSKFNEICLNNPRIFRDLEPIKDAVESIKELTEYYNCFFLSTPMWILPESYMDKRLWIENHFGNLFENKLILSHRKDLLQGNIIIDDRKINGVENFKGLHIHFGQEEFPDWETTKFYLRKKAVLKKWELEKIFL